VGAQATYWLVILVRLKGELHVLTQKRNQDPPDSIPIAEFMRNEKYGRHPLAKSRNPFTCGLTGRTYSAAEFFHRSEALAKSLSERMSWNPNEGTAWDKVIGIFSLNTVSTPSHLAFGRYRTT
jgi:hypothetical protein